MQILAFLQNQWFRDPARWERFMTGPHRRKYLRFALFGGCLSGQRLILAGFADLENIIWENVSPRIASKASECFGVDQAHVDAVIDDVKPDIVLLFGKVAQSAQIQAPQIIRGPHPAARHAGVNDELRAMAKELKLLIARGATV